MSLTSQSLELKVCFHLCRNLQRIFLVFILTKKDLILIQTNAIVFYGSIVLPPGTNQRFRKSSELLSHTKHMQCFSETARLVYHGTEISFITTMYHFSVRLYNNLWLVQQQFIIRCVLSRCMSHCNCCHCYNKCKSNLQLSIDCMCM